MKIDTKETVENIIEDDLFNQPFMIELFGEEPEYNLDDSEESGKEMVLIEIAKVDKSSIKKIESNYAAFETMVKKWAKEHDLDSYFNAIYFDEDTLEVTIVFDIPGKDDFWNTKKAEDGTLVGNLNEDQIREVLIGFYNYSRNNGAGADLNNEFEYNIHLYIDNLKAGSLKKSANGTKIDNTDAAFKIFKQKLEDAMFEKYAISLNDTGFDDTHVKLAIENNESIENIVNQIGEKYELTPVSAAGLALDIKTDKKPLATGAKMYICTVKDKNGKMLGEYPMSYKNEDYVNSFLSAIGLKLKVSDTKEITEA